MLNPLLFEAVNTSAFYDDKSFVVAIKNVSEIGDFVYTLNAMFNTNFGIKVLISSSLGIFC